ncbi:MAG: PBSX family phage terminase large subunit, partial [Pseudoclavibacter sp.]
MATLSPKQKQSLREADGRVNVWEGSVRSGKTYSSVLAYLLELAADPTGGEFLITGKNRDSIYRNFFGTIDKADGLRAFRSAVQYRAGAPTARILGHEVHVIGANDASSESRIRGATILRAYADELTVLDKGFVKQLL